MQTIGEVIDSPRPVMTFRVAGEWLAIPVEQVERIAQTATLWPVPMSVPQHLGLLDDGNTLVPVLRLDAHRSGRDHGAEEQLVAILHVRGEAVGLAIDAAGRVYHGFRSGPTGARAPGPLAAIGARPIYSSDGPCWLIDPDELWRDLETQDPL
ncbi:MAG: chemotaxis protein CheW [Deltaproteobacteria bacterium]|nr:chemotaxis protein CheW [Deltaproteobacteria bacterium]